MLFVCALLALVACGPASFEATLQGEATLPAAPMGEGDTPLDAFPAIGGFTNLDFNQNQDFQNQDITKARVTSARLVSFQLRVLAPPTQDFSFLDSLECFAQSRDLSRRVAFKQDIASLKLHAPNPVLTLDVTDEELQTLLAAPSMSLVVRAKGRMPPGEVRLRAEVRIRVSAGR